MDINLADLEAFNGSSYADELGESSYADEQLGESSYADEQLGESSYADEPLSVANCGACSGIGSTSRGGKRETPRSRARLYEMSSFWSPQPAHFLGRLCLVTY